MKRITAMLACFLAWGAGKAFAQTDSTTFAGSLTDDTKAVANYDLQGCVQYALDNNETFKKAQYQVRIAKEDIGERLAVGLPHITLEANAINNLVVPRMFLPDGRLFGMPPGPVAVTFQTQFSGAANIKLNQLLFDFSYLVGVRAARAFMALTEKQVDVTKADVKERVTKAFYGVLINRERMTLVELNVARMDSILKDVKSLNANGLVEKMDVMRAEVALNNMRTELKKIKQLQEVTLQLLKFQMGMPVRDSLTVEGSLRDITLALEEDMNTPLERSKRPEFALLDMNQTMQELNLAYNKSIYYPRLYLFGAAGANTGQNQFNDLWKFHDRWFKSAYVGLSLQWNIFDGFRRKHALNKIRLEILKIKEDRNSLQRGIDFELEKSKTALKANIEDLEIQRRNMGLAQEVVALAQVKFKNGTGTNLDIINAQAAFKEAENNYYTALYNTVLNKIDLQKALGKL